MSAMRLITASAVMVVLLGSAPSALGQGCALCRTTAEAAGAQGTKALNLAILVLLIPTVLIFVGIFFLAFRYRNQSLAEQDAGDAAAARALSPGASDRAFTLHPHPD